MPSPKKSSMIEIVTHFWDPVWLRAWAAPYHSQKGWKAFGVRQMEVFILTARSVVQEEISLRAAALTYRTLLSIVPLLAVGFALFKAFGGLKKFEAPLREVIIENMAVGRGQEVGHWLEKFISNINAGAIAGVGVLVLIYSAVGLLTNIEGSLNKIWGIKRGRPLVTRFFIYWGLITLSPVLIGLSVSLTAQLQNSAFATGVVNWLPWGLGRVVVWLATALSTCLAFVLAYLIVPNTRVRLKAALLGGIVAGMLWNLSKVLFISVSAGSIKYSAVYGALGVLPLLMLWSYISWLIVLFGATYAYANQSVYTEGLELSTSRLNQSFREVLALHLLTIIARRFRAGEEPLNAEELGEQISAPISLVHRVLDVLEAHDVVRETEGAKSGEGGYLPARSLQELTVEQIVAVLRDDVGSDFGLADRPEFAEATRILREGEAACREVLAKTSLRSLTDGEAQAVQAE